MAFFSPIGWIETSRLYTSARRNFICRMKNGNICEESVVNEPAPGLDSQYAVIHCTGFLRVIKQI